MHVMMILAYERTDGDCPQEYSVTRTWTATDACGNTSTATQTINVIDITPPVISGVGPDGTIECPDEPQFSSPSATDACDDDPSLTFEDERTDGDCPQEYSVTRTWTATDACGNTSTATQTINVIDITPPVISGVGPDGTIECPDEPQFSSPSATDACDDDPSLTFEDERTDGDCPQEYSVTRTWTATDACGNTSTATQTINVIDITPPVISGVGPDGTIECPDEPQFSSPSATDACDDDPSLTFEDERTDGDCPQEYSVTRTWTATDACGNTSTATQTINVIDITPPVISGVGPDGTIECPDEPQFSSPSATDACDDDPSLTFEDERTDGDCPQEYSVTRTWTATDACGNTSTATQTINVIDITPPVISGVGPDGTIECPDEPQFSSPSATDACDDDPSLTFEDERTDGDCPQEYSVTRTWTATDACGNTSTATQTINVIDITPPVISGVGPDGTIECPDEPQFSSPSATDACDDDPSLTFEDERTDGDCPQEYSVTRTWTATDACGNTSTATQTINVIDITPPVISGVGPDGTIECPDEPQFSSPSATDACDDDPSLTFEDERTDGDCPQEYSVTRTWTATDACGNTSTATQTINVIDITPPVISGVGPDGTIECPDEPQFSSPSATDACDDDPSLTFEDERTDGDCPQEYSVTRTWTATDACGNTSTATQTINVIDITPPVISGVGPDGTIECPDEPQFSSPSATDACDDDPSLTFEDERTDGDCPQEYSVTRTWTATDACGNTSTATQTINVIDITPPVISGVGPDGTIECPDEPQFSSPSATDACDDDPSLTFEDERTDGDCPQEYSVTRTWTATDACGNTSTATQTINVIDITPPVISGVGPDGTIECPDEPQFSSPSATDACDDDPSLTFEDERTDGDCPQEYSVTRTWTATDACGNTSTATQTINVIDITPPVISGVGPDGTIECPDEPQFSSPSATDACDDDPSLTFEDERTDGDCPQEYSVTRTWTATDACGNTSTATQTINVIDITPPVISGVGPDGTIECPDEPQFSSPSATDACDDDPSLTFEDERTDGDCPQEYSVTRTWTATDACGNTSTATQTINVIDITPPVISGVGPDGTIECPDEPQFSSPSATDACDDDPSLTFEDERTDGDCPQEYSVTRTWTATDACGNTSTATQTINVIDITPPVISGVGPDGTIECPDEPQFSSPSATDACDDDPSLTFEDERTDGDCPQEYSVTRTWTATDACGNTSTATQTINVIDITPPVISGVGPDGTIECPDEPQFSSPSATDACDDDPSLTFEDERTDGDCPQEYSVTRTWTATDACGNTSTATQTINVIDITPPVISGVGPDGTIECPDEPQFSSPSATDACDDDPSLTFEDERTDGDCPQEYSVTRTWTATDACGNTSTATQTINVIDITPPVISGVGPDGTIECPDEPQFSSPSATDACDDDPSLTFEDERTDGDCPQEYSVTRTWTATDACGNTSTATQTINVIDITPPVISGVGPDGTIECPDEPQFSSPSATDACDDDPSLTFEDERTDGDCPQEYSVTRTWTATDACGNTSTATQTINVIDITPPVIECPESVDLGCEPDIIPDASPSEATATDDCDDDLVVTVEQGEVVIGPDGCTMSRRDIFKATDCAGNTSTCTRTLTWEIDCEPICETAFAMGEEALCFLDDPDLNTNRWGWTNKITPGEYEFDIWAGAGQCDVSKGELAGTLLVNYHNSGLVEVTYQMNPGFTLQEVHLWVGCEKYPLGSNGEITVAPGQYPFGCDIIDETTCYTSVMVSGCDEIYIIAHAVTCTTACGSDNGGGDPPVVDDDCCTDGDKPERMAFMYTASDCSSTSHSQSSGSVSCEDFGDLPNSVYIVAWDKQKGYEWFAGQVNLGEVYIIDALKDPNNKPKKLGPTTTIDIYTSEDGDLLQTVEFHTSCSQPLVIDDQFGASKVVGIDHPNGIVCGEITDRTFSPVVKIPKRGRTGVSARDGMHQGIEIGVYPNPADRFVKVDLSNRPQGEVVIHLHDALGRHIKEYKFFDNEVIMTLILPELAVDGMYFLRIRVDDNVESIPIVISKSQYQFERR